MTENYEIIGFYRDLGFALDKTEGIYFIYNRSTRKMLYRQTDRKSASRKFAMFVVSYINTEFEEA